MNFILRKGQNFLSTKLRNGYELLSRSGQNCCQHDEKNVLIEWIEINSQP